MSDNRYVILNCPTLMGNRLCYGKTIKQCVDCTDCVMKKIAELCKGAQSKEYRKGRRRFRSPSKASFGRDVLQLLQIEEVE